MDSVLAVLMALLAKSDHKHFVLRDPLSVDVDDVMVMLCRGAANAVRISVCDPVTITALRGFHLERDIIVEFFKDGAALLWRIVLPLHDLLLDLLLEPFGKVVERRHVV